MADISRFSSFDASLIILETVAVLDLCNGVELVALGLTKCPQRVCILARVRRRIRIAALVGAGFRGDVAQPDTERRQAATQDDKVGFDDPG